MFPGGVPRGRAKALPVNRIIECPPPSSCPKCKSPNIIKYGKASKIVHDLKFSRVGIKRWTVRFLFHEYLCYQCDARFWPRQRQWTRSKIGSGLLAYIIYQIIELRLSQEAVTQSLNQLFDVNLSHTRVNRQKSRASFILQRYLRWNSQKDSKRKVDPCGRDQDQHQRKRCICMGVHQSGRSGVLLHRDTRR